MNFTKTIRSLLVATALITVGSTAMALQQNITLPNGSVGVIDWSKRKLVSTGTGVAPRNASSAAQKEVLARRAAVVDAQRNLLETILGTNISSKTTVLNLEANDVIRSEAAGLLQGAVITTEKWERDIYTVNMEIPLETVREFCAEKLKIKIDIAAPTVIKVSAPTSLIIDARNLKIAPSVFVKVFDIAGSTVFESITATYSPALPGNFGDPVKETAKLPEAGARPLIIKAFGIQDKVNIVISAGDAGKLTSFADVISAFEPSQIIVIAN
jgi:hypothetical protein